MLIRETPYPMLSPCEEPIPGMRKLLSADPIYRVVLVESKLNRSSDGTDAVPSSLLASRTWLALLPDIRVEVLLLIRRHHCKSVLAENRLALLPLVFGVQIWSTVSSVLSEPAAVDGRLSRRAYCKFVSVI